MQGKYQGEVSMQMSCTDLPLSKDLLPQAAAVLAAPLGIASAAERCLAQGHIHAGHS